MLKIGIRLFFDLKNKVWMLFNKQLRIKKNVQIRQTRIKRNTTVEIDEGCRIGRNCIFVGAGGNIKIGKNVSINDFSLIAGCKVTIGDNVLIAARCSLIAENHIFDNIKIPIKKQGLSYKGINIEDDVWLGTGVIILDGVTIGKGAVIGAGSVVTKSIPAMSVAVGNPARVIKSRITEEDDNEFKRV